MLKRFRRVNLPLAAKCQLLFGAAFVLIIATALFMPFRRMEQLMEQLNERAASALAEAAVKEHVLDPGQTTSRRWAAATGPATQPVVIDGHPYLPPRLLSAIPPRPPDAEVPTRFEQSALRAFRRHPETSFYAKYYETRDGYGYRYARPLYAEASCLSCHAQSPLTPTTNPGPATQAVTQLAPGTLMGIVTVDIKSQVDPNQLLLNRIILLSAGLLAGCLAIGVFYLITTRLILRPVRVLQETAEKVSEGNLNIRTDIDTGDEFQQLGETINTMLGNLLESEGQLRAINKSLDLKLGQLAESNLALYESNRLKGEFIANVSHELRTPLNSILGFAELLRDAAGKDAGKSQRYVQNILRSGQALLELINDLLDLAKIEAGRMEVRSEPLSLNDLFEGLVSILKPLTEPKGVTIEPRMAPDVPIMQTDPAKLQQVLYNFLSNAIKFSPSNEVVALSAVREGADRVRISVADRGPGIEEKQQGVIFEKFRQIDGSVTRQHSGTGLGLAISKELTALLGGTIGVQSVPGEGATFWVVLPIKIQASVQDVRGKMVMSESA